MAVMTRDAIEQLSVQDRLELIDALWESLPDDDVPLTDAHLTKAQLAELERRLETLEQERPHAVSWNVVKAEMTARRAA